MGACQGSLLNKRRKLIFAIGAGALTVSGSSRAQSAGSILRIGWLAPGTAASQTVLLDVLRRGLRDIGYIEGKNLVIEARWADGNLDRLPQLARDLAALKVVAITTVMTPTAIAAKNAVTDVPIVFTLVADATMLVQTLAHPGGNVTGLTGINLELAPKRLETLREVLPSVKRVAVIYRSDSLIDRSKLDATIRTARTLGLNIIPVDTRNNSYAEAFQHAAASGAEAAVVFFNNYSFDARRAITSFAAKYRIATMYEMSIFVADGGLISYSANQYAQIGRAAAYLDKIFKGARPGDLPVEQPTTLELAINPKQAKALGINFPTAITMRADTVIE
jgi:putative ABC transport system substrate-binding protein